MSDILSPEVIAAAKAHAIREFPKEACGYVTPMGYFEVENISSTPEENFEVSTQDVLSYEGSICFIHSHPVADAYNHARYKPGFYPYCPSEPDMVSQISSIMPWAIIVTDGQNAMDPFIWGDFILNLPIYDRPFRHGVEDCYTIAQKWFWQTHQIRLPEIPRSDQWWTTNQNLYMANFPGAGFTRLGRDEPLKAGDCGLIQIGGKQVKCLNHLVLYLGDGTVAHHLPNRLSTRDAIGGRLSEINVWLRHKDLMI